VHSAGLTRRIKNAGRNLMIKHVVFFKFKPDTSVDDRDAGIAALKALPGKIDLIRTFELGEDVLRSPRSWDLVLIATYDDIESLKIYSDHPDHVLVVALLKSLCETIGSVDYHC
jgi:hypothetical protein